MYKKYIFQKLTVIVAHALHVKNQELTDTQCLNTPCAIELLFTYLIEIAVVLMINVALKIPKSQNSALVKKILRILMGNIFTPGILWTINSVTENKP